MCEAVTMPSLMMMVMTSTVSEESLARDTHTQIQTDFILVILNFLKVIK